MSYSLNLTYSTAFERGGGSVEEKRLLFRLSWLNHIHNVAVGMDATQPSTEVVILTNHLPKHNKKHDVTKLVST